MTDTPGWRIRAPVAVTDGLSIHWTQCSGAPAAIAASRTMRAASALHRWAAGWKAKTTGLRVLSASSALNHGRGGRVGHRGDRADHADRLGDLDDAVDLVAGDHPDGLEPGHVVRHVLAREDVLDGLVLEQAAAGLLDGQLGQLGVPAQRRHRRLGDDRVDVLLGEGVVRGQRRQSALDQRVDHAVGLVRRFDGHSGDGDRCRPWQHPQGRERARTARSPSTVMISAPSHLTATT
ncbi:hypothetical protein [Actinoplanes nipponensis]|uniref:hypothetical protein n=1 Tax=Actinoplanes nipponensis TaxID=135950 RepID=UPI0031EB3A28